MNNRGEGISVIMWGCLGLALAFVLYLLCGKWFREIDLDTSIVPVDIIVFLLSSALTLYLGYYITKKLTEQRAEKDLLIGDLAKIEASIGDIEASIKYPGGINVQQLSTIAEGVVLCVDRFKRALQVAGNTKLTTSELEILVYRLYNVATNFDGQTWDIDNIPVGVIRKSATEMIVEVRRLAHLINAQ